MRREQSHRWGTLCVRIPVVCAVWVCLAAFAVQAQTLTIQPGTLNLDVNTNDVDFVTVSRDSSSGNLTLSTASGDASIFTLFDPSPTILNGSTCVAVYVQAQGAGITSFTASASGYSTVTSWVQVTETAVAPGPPNALFSASRMYGSPPLTVVFDSSASTADPSTTLTNRLWDFENDGTPDAQGIIVTNVYASTGMFTAELVVYDGNGASDTNTTTISVFDPSLRIEPSLLSLNLDGSYVLGTVRVVRVGGNIRSNLQVTMTSDNTDVYLVNSPIYITAYSLTSEPVIIYGRAPGLERLYATASDYPSTQSWVAISYSNQLALLTANPMNASVSQDVVYTATPLAPGITNYIWDFDGDGSTDAEGSGLLVQTNVFTAAGVYTSSLVVMDMSAQIQTSAVVITVSTGGPPTAVINVNTNTGTAPLTVIFDGTGSFDPGGSIVSYSWDVDGDGSSDSSLPVYTNTYGSDGVYTAYLDVVDNNSLTGTASTLIYVGSGPGPSSNSPPVIDFIPSPPFNVLIGEYFDFWAFATETDGDTVYLSASNLPSGSSYAPNPDSGTGMALGQFSWTPWTPGNYQVDFYAWDPDGATQRTVNILVASNIPSSYVGLMISRYVEGTNQTYRAIELYNRSGDTIPANDVYLQFYYYPDGINPSVQNLVITNDIPNNQKIVVVPKNANPDLLARFSGSAIYRAASTGFNWFDGNDAIVLRSGFYLLDDGVYGPIIDSIGQIDSIIPGGKCTIDVPPNSTNYWGTVSDNTRNHTLTRQASVTNGWTNPLLDFHPSTEAVRWNEWVFTDEPYGGGSGPLITNFSIVGMAPTNGGLFSLTFESTNGQNFVLETVTNLWPTFDHWVAVQSITASSSTTVFNVDFTNTWRYYRVRTAP